MKTILSCVSFQQDWLPGEERHYKIVFFFCTCFIIIKLQQVLTWYDIWLQNCSLIVKLQYTLNDQNYGSSPSGTLILAILFRPFQSMSGRQKNCIRSDRKNIFLNWTYCRKVLNIQFSQTNPEQIHTVLLLPNTQIIWLSNLWMFSVPVFLFPLLLITVKIMIFGLE